MIRVVYTTEEGYSVEKWFSNRHRIRKFVWVTMPSGIRSRAYRDYSAAAMKPGDLYPRWSNAMRYDPRRAKEFHDLMESNGVPGCELNAKGQARVDSVEHQNKMMQVLRIANLDAGYRDRAPTAY